MNTLASPAAARHPTRSFPWLLFACTVLTTLFAPGALEAGLEGAWHWRAFLRPDPAYSACVLSILGAHELGHYLACRLYGVAATPPHFIPGLPPVGTFGALIRIRGPIPHRRALFDIAAAGPLAGFALALPVLVVGVWRAHPAPSPDGEALILGPPLVAQWLVAWRFPGLEVPLEVDSIYLAGWVGMLVTSLNLFPVGQLDGGHVAYALSPRLHRAAAWGTVGAMLVLLLFQGAWLGFPPAYLLWFLVLLWMRDRHPRLLDERERLGPLRRLVALLLLAVFVASFMPVPVVIGALGSP